MGKILWLLPFVLGIVIALIGAGLDNLLPAASPGFNLPQLLVVCAGLALSGTAVLARRERFRRRLSNSLKKNIVSAFVISLFTLLALETTLTVLDMPTYFPQELPDADYQVVSWVTCDEDGCRMNYEEVVAQCAAGELSGRYCIVNRQGYPNLSDFAARQADDERFRIVTLGDSFTQGFSADIGQSYVEYLAATIPDADIWNLAIAGTGTVQDLRAYSEVAPAFEPQLTILGFNMNDFDDNLLLHFTGVQLRDAEGNMYFPEYPKSDRWGRPIQLPQRLVLRYAIAGSAPPMSDLEARLGVTRLGTIALRLLDRAGNAVSGGAYEQVERTRQYLAQLRDAVLALDSGFLVLLIPQMDDIDDPGENMANSIMFMEELDVHYLNLISLLTEQDYVPLPDGHWNNSGHQKIGALVSDCVRRFIDSGRLADCDTVMMP